LAPERESQRKSLGGGFWERALPEKKFWKNKRLGGRVPIEKKRSRQRENKSLKRGKKRWEVWKKVGKGNQKVSRRKVQSWHRGRFKRADLGGGGVMGKKGVV